MSPREATTRIEALTTSNFALRKAPSTVSSWRSTGSVGRTSRAPFVLHGRISPKIISKGLLDRALLHPLEVDLGGLCVGAQQRRVRDGLVGDDRAAGAGPRGDRIRR